MRPLVFAVALLLLAGVPAATAGRVLHQAADAAPAAAAKPAAATTKPAPTNTINADLSGPRPGREPAGPKPPFPWGVATSAFQSEGASDADGRGPSIWDSFISGSPVDAYNRWRDDLAVLQKLGIKHYRTSLAWTRLYPDGDGSKAPNAAAIAHYKEWFKAYADAGIDILLTLYHFDLPNALQEKYGGWTDERIVDDFVAYAKTAFKEFGPYVKTWLTFNEPKNGCFLGWSTGVFAPFLKDPASQTPEGSAAGWKCMHNMVAAHAGAAKAYAGLKAPVGGGTLGAALDTEWTIPLDPANPKDVEAAQRYIDYRLGIFADPLWKGDWPASVKARIPPTVLPPISESLRKDLLAHKPSTFFLNHYSTKVVKDAPGNTGGYGEGLTDYGEQYEFANGTKVGPVADSGWLYVYPSGLRSLLNYVYKTYKPKSVVVSESGVDVPDEAKLGRGEVLADAFRVNYYKGYVQAAADAKAKDGVPVDLYLAWSLTDGVEWAEKMTKLFGIVWTDYDKGGERVPKDSAYWLAETFRTLNETGPSPGGAAGAKPAAPKPAAEPAATPAAEPAAKPAAEPAATPAATPAKAGEPASI